MLDLYIYIVDLAVGLLGSDKLASRTKKGRRVIWEELVQLARKG